MPGGFSNTTFSTTRFSSVKSAFREADALLGKRTQRKLGNNTYIRREGLLIVVRLHATDIIKIGKDRIVLDSGGYRTKTTKERINAVLPHGYGLSADKGLWHLRTPKGAYTFADGCELKPNGRAANVGDEKADTKLVKAIHKYAKLYAAAALAGKLPAPGAGDCLLCQMHVADGANAGKALGDVSGDDHIRSHIAEGYVVPSLLVNAAREAGNGYLLNVLLPFLWDRSIGGEDRKARLANQYRPTVDIARVVRKYCGRRLGLACR
jgi:hypothetical protein